MTRTPKVVSALGALLLVVPLSACSGTTADVQGEVLVQWRDGVLGLDSAKGYGGMDCLTSGGFDDIVDGAQVLVLNSEGTAIAKGNLGAGATSDEDANVCVFPFQVENVTLEGDLFSVSIAGREGPTFDKDELLESLSLSLL